MMNVRKYYKFHLPLIIGFICLFFPKDTYAWTCDWCQGLVDWVVDKATNAALGILGLDNDVNCDVPATETSFCMFCPLFKLIFNAASLIAQRSYMLFGKDLVQVLLIFLAVSLALIIIKHVSSMGGTDTSALMNELLPKIFIGVVIFIILNNNYYYVLSLTLNPIFDMLMMFVMPTGGNSCSGSEGLLIASGAGGNSPTGGGLPDIGVSIVCTVQAIEQKINLLFEFGEWAFCRGNGPDRLLLILPHPIYIIDGILFYIGGIFFMVAYPWIMADAVLQLGIAMALLPFAICGRAFGKTSEYLSKVLEWILNSAFVFIFTSLVISVILDYVGSVLMAAITNNPLTDAKEIFTDPNRGLAFWGPNMILIIFILSIGWTYLPLVKNLSKEFAGGSGVGAAQTIGSAATQKMENAAHQVGHKAEHAAVETGKWAGRGIKRGSKAVVRYGMVKTVNAMGGSVNIGGVTFSTTGGNSDVLQRTWVNPLNGRKHVMTSDRYSTTFEEFNGTERIKSRTDFKHNFANEYLIDEKGDVNIGAMNKILNSPSALADPEIQKTQTAQFAKNVLKAKGIEIGEYRTSENIKVVGPGKIVVEQVDYAGKTTTYAMEVDMATGRVAVATHIKNKDGSESLTWDNGFSTVNIQKDKKGKETCTAKYSNRAQARHSHFSDEMDYDQVVDKTGKIAEDLDPRSGKCSPENSLTHGANLIQDILGGGRTGEDILVNDVWKQMHAKHSSKLSTSIL